MQQGDPPYVRIARSLRRRGVMKKCISLIAMGLLCLTSCQRAEEGFAVVNGQLSSCPKRPNCVHSQAVGAACFIDPISTTGSEQVVRAQALEILKSFDRVKIVVVENNYIRAEFTSRFFRFVDDLELYFPATGLDEVVIHVRSASRIGYSDFGVNRKRVERIRSRFNAINQAEIIN
jgi:uncharacterized protein (DUF1499 family)